MKKLIKKILKEFQEDWDWIEYIEKPTLEFYVKNGFLQKGVRYNLTGRFLVELTSRHINYPGIISKEMESRVLPENGINVEWVGPKGVVKTNYVTFMCLDDVGTYDKYQLINIYQESFKNIIIEDVDILKEVDITENNDFDWVRSLVNDNTETLQFYVNNDLLIKGEQYRISGEIWDYDTRDYHPMSPFETTFNKTDTYNNDLHFTLVEPIQLNLTNNVIFFDSGENIIFNSEVDFESVRIEPVKFNEFSNFGL